MSFYRDIEDVVQAIKRARDRNININLLIGAGCSVSSGIPTATGIVEDIKQKYPREYERTLYKNYANCMSKLTPTERRNLITEYVNVSKINWTHISIAQLFMDGFINRVLTTNFDNLLQRACSLVNETPAIYDLATSTEFRPDLLFDKSILHLHGQHTGFILCNTESEVKKQAESLKSVFSDLKQQSMWIIVGYSGENDPIFDLLCKESMFEHRLFLIGYKDNEPSDKYLELLSEDKYSFYVNGFDADDFFVTLAQKLSCFPPKFVHKPFSYLAESLGQITEYKLPSSRGYRKDLKLSTYKIIEKAINEIETNNLLMAENYFMAGLYNKVIELDENDSELYYIKSKSFAELNNIEHTYKAIEYLEKHIAIKGEDSLSCIQYINIYQYLCLRELSEDEQKNTENLLNLINYHLKSFVFETEENYIDATLFIVFTNLSKIIDKYQNFPLNKKVFNSLNKLLEISIESFEENRNKDKNRLIDLCYSTLCSLPYYLIKIGDIKISKKLIDTILNYDQISRSFTLANLGLWYFTNDELSLEMREKNGKENYKKAIKIAEQENESLHLPLVQKYYYELANFYYCVDRDHDSIENCLKAYELGEIEKYETNFNDILVLMEVLKIDKYDEVAVSIEE